MPLCLEIPAIDVDDVREGLKSIKGNSHGENHVEHDVVLSGAEQPYDARHAFQNKIYVFEKYEQTQTNHERDGKPYLFRPLLLCGVDSERRRISGQRGDENQSDQPHVPAHIKQAAGGEQEYPSSLVRQQPVQKDDDGKKNEKSDRIEIHFIFLPFSRAAANSAQKTPPPRYRLRTATRPSTTRKPH